MRMMEGGSPVNVLTKAIAFNNPFSPDLREMAKPLSASLI
jgi:hypothetical protein